MTERIARIAGIGSYLPEKILTNDEISRLVDTSDSWIRERTGIRQRHIAPEGVTTADLAEQACRRALRRLPVSGRPASRPARRPLRTTSEPQDHQRDGP